MTPEDLAAIRKRWEAASLGIWRWLYNGLQTEIMADNVTVTYWDERDRADPPKDADLEFMVHAHQDIPVLLARIESLEKELEHARYDLYHNQPR